MYLHTNPHLATSTDKLMQVPSLQQSRHASHFCHPGHRLTVRELVVDHADAHCDSWTNSQFTYGFSFVDNMSPRKISKKLESILLVSIMYSPLRVQHLK